MKSEHAANRGFTVIEILVSMVLLATVAGLALSAFSNSTKVAQLGSKSNTCYNLARQGLDRLDEAVRADWWPSNGQPLSITSPGPQPANTTLDPGATVYTSSYTVSDPDAGGPIDYRRVTMTVTST